VLTASAGTVDGKSYSAQSFTRLLQLLNSQLADYDDAIAAAIAEHPDTSIFTSFPAPPDTRTHQSGRPMRRGRRSVPECFGY
jgi:hypothetical protein